ncbi:uncharacterized protein RAG0_14440 [Rhynchosporium agropyri]|uniref:Uncharacterized protein n=1 Tax=Rhynchosporium agropyri TaxID=914238 RepID=A0A1E1LH19_9HELO|nr:uncharacterized protein RAG0_14440 [Rhynchosporium agropyri]
MVKPPPDSSDQQSENDNYDTSSPNGAAKRRLNNANTPKRTVNTPHKPFTPRTPVRKTPAQTTNNNGSAQKTPASAPARARRVNEPTLLGDFLLGRPSPARQRMARRKSLDLVKKEMRAEVVAKVQPPGKVQERVKEWQKASAGAGRGQKAEEIVVEYETDSELEVVVVQEKEKLVRSTPKRPTPARRKERVREEVDEEEDEFRCVRGRNNGDAERARAKSLAPKKRVISDGHWRTKSPPRKGNNIPKNFLQATAINPPVEKKIEDWVRRTEHVEPEIVLEKPKPRSRSRKAQEWEQQEESPESRKPSRQTTESPRSTKVSKQEPFDDGIRVRPLRSTSRDDGIRIKPSKDRPKREDRKSSATMEGSSGVSNFYDDGIRVTASKMSPNDDGIRVRPSRDTSPQSELRVKAIRKDGGKRRPKSEGESSTIKLRRKSNSHVTPSSESDGKSRVTRATSHQDEEDDYSYVTPTRKGSRGQGRKSLTPPESMDEIPFGNSAFNSLELPVGAEAGTMRRPEPKRNPSFAAVPKVLKRVYTEGKKMMHDKAEPPRGGTNQPPSIDSWLNGTVDPFVDGPTPKVAGSEVTATPVSRMRTYKEEDRAEKGLERDVENTEARSPRRKRKSLEEEELLPEPLHIKHRNRDALPSMEISPPASPSALKRSAATRNISSSKSTWKLSLKEAVIDAFKGESSMGKSAPSPFDFIGLREKDVNQAEEYRPRDLESVPEDPPPKENPRAQDKPVFEQTRSSRAPLSIPRRLAPTTGGHRLSTIASIETFTTLSSESSLTETSTGSEVSHTTVTQESVLTGTTGSSLSRHSKASTGSKDGLKRRLTKHSDLVSMLSLPDAELPGRGHSIKSARSIRTTRTNLDTATVRDLMKELAEDETKYMRELNTLVDGVIPVLLTCVLSKSDSAVAAGLFDPSGTDISFTKPIVDMGVALERLKRLHKRIPLTSQDDFLRWAQSACKTYEDYLRAWRSGFGDVVVNLAPASRTSSSVENHDPNKMRIDEHGDVLRDTGERADVGYMLKRPLVRIKGLAKAARGLEKILHTKASKDVMDAYEELEKYRRQRIRAEVARKEDQRANNTDASRARDPKTMAHTKDVTINRDRQVYMKDMFSFEMIHSNGQHLECEVELTLRINESNSKDTGDVLICQTDGTKYFLLFPPVSMNLISARKGDSDTELVLMIRGKDGTRSEWRESFMIDAKEVDVATEWLEKLGTTPVPPPIIHYKSKLDPELEMVLSEAGDDTRSIVGALKASKTDDDIPLGERPRREAEEAISGGVPGLMHTVYQIFSEDKISELGEYNILDVKDLNDAMRKAGKKPLALHISRQTTPQRQRPSKYQGKNVEVCVMPCVMSGARNEDDLVATTDWKDKENAGMILRDIPKLRSPRSEKPSTPLKEAMRPELESMKRYHKVSPTRDEDTPPPPPAHRTPSPSLKTTPPLDSPTPRGKNRRTSSPLKHEYQPSDASGTSSSSEQSDSDSYSEDSEESADELDELLSDDETAPINAATLPISRPESIYSQPNACPAPSNSASQSPFIGRPTPPRPSTATNRIAAMVSLWSDKKGKWEDIYADPCSVVVGPGRVECFDLSSVHSSPTGPDVASPKKHSRSSDPLVGQDITPHVNLRQSTRIDIEITAPPSASSRMKGVALTLRYRTLSQQDCDALYAALHKARMENLKFKMMEQQRMFASYGQNSAYEKAVAGGRHGFLLKKQSFRRADGNAPPQSSTDSEQSSSLSSAISAVKRFGIGGIFNISKSSIQQGCNGPMSNSSSDYSGNTPPHTRSPSLAASGSMFSNGVTVRDLGWQDLKIRLYIGLTCNKWDDRGGARLTVTAPPPGMRQASALDHGPEKRITVTIPNKNSDEGQAPPNVLLDCVLGAQCFSKLGQRGVVASIWEDIIGDDGIVGRVAARGGLSGRVRKVCFQMARQGDCEWVYMLCRSGMA